MPSNPFPERSRRTDEAWEWICITSEKLVYKKVKPRCVHTPGPWTPLSARSTVEWGLVTSLFYLPHSFSLTLSLIQPSLLPPYPFTQNPLMWVILGLTHQFSCQACHSLPKLCKLLRTLWFLLFLLTTCTYKSFCSPPLKGDTPHHYSSSCHLLHLPCCAMSWYRRSTRELFRRRSKHCL